MSAHVCVSLFSVTYSSLKVNLIKLTLPAQFIFQKINTKLINDLIKLNQIKNCKLYFKSLEKLTIYKEQISLSNTRE